MNFFGSPKRTRNEQSDVFSNNIVEDMGKNFNFMNEPNIDTIDTIIDNMLIFLKSKLKLINTFPEPNTNRFSSLEGEQLDNVKILISLGLIEINSKNQDDKRNHFKLDQLETASFKKDTSASLFIQYISEYIKKLEDLKNFSIDEKASTEFSSKDNSQTNTTYELTLHRAMTFFVNKNKFLIFDIYLNHYVQYMYLLFAINVFKNAKYILELNASRQKKDIMLNKVIELSQMYNELETKDDKNKTDSLKQQLSTLIEQFESIQNVEEENKKSSGGGLEKCKCARGGCKNGTCGCLKGGSNVRTLADNVINELLVKHKHFLNVFRKTRDALPEYFNTINSLIIEKMTDLKNLKTSISVLTAQEYEIISKTDKEMLEFFKKNDLQLDYDIKNNPSVKESITYTLKKLSDDIDDQLKGTISKSESLYRETDRTADVVLNNDMNPNVTPNNVIPSVGGFVRGSTLFPKNNYKNKTK
jgi:hypothetical protein